MVLRLSLVGCSPASGFGMFYHSIDIKAIAYKYCGETDSGLSVDDMEFVGTVLVKCCPVGVRSSRVQYGVR